MIGYMIHKIREWRHRRRAVQIRRLIRDIIQCQQQIHCIKRQLIEYREEQYILNYMKSIGNTTYDDDIRLIMIQDEIIHIPFQLDVYIHNIRRMKKRLKYIRGSDSLITDTMNEEECDCYH